MRYDVPGIIVSHFGTQVVSFEFKKFYTMFTVKHVTTDPSFSISNGQAERFLDLFKGALRKSNKEFTDEIALQQFLIV